MITYEDECVGCPTEMGCMGSACPYRNVPHLYCDKCEQEVDDLYEWDDEQVCIDCILKSLDKVKIE